MFSFCRTASAGGVKRQKVSNEKTYFEPCNNGGCIPLVLMVYNVFPQCIVESLYTVGAMIIPVIFLFCSFQLFYIFFQGHILVIPLVRVHSCTWLTYILLMMRTKCRILAFVGELVYSFAFLC
jgi:hypothetical protein